MRIDLRLIKHFGISLNSNKKYFIEYDPQTWCIMGIWDDFEKALKDGYNTTIEEYRKICDGQKIFTHQNKDGTYNAELADENFVGDNYIFYKGFVQNLNMWQLLNTLRTEIKENEEDTYYIGYQIDSNMKSYPDFVNALLDEMDGKRNPNI